MKLTKREAEFLLIALQWAEQDRESLADAHRVGYDNKILPEGRKAIRDQKRVFKLRQKVRKWLDENKGTVFLTANNRISEMKDLVEVPIQDIAKLAKPKRPTAEGDWQEMDATSWAKDIHARKVIAHIEKTCPRLGKRRVLVLAKKWIAEGRSLVDDEIAKGER